MLWAPQLDLHGHSREHRGRLPEHPPAVARRARLGPPVPRARGNRLPALGTSGADRPWSDASACDSVMAPHRPAAIRVGAAEPRTPDSRTAPLGGRDLPEMLTVDDVAVTTLPHLTE